MNSVTLYSVHSVGFDVLYIPACFTTKFSVANNQPPIRDQLSQRNDVRERKYCELTRGCFRTYSIIDHRTVKFSTMSTWQPTVKCILWEFVAIPHRIVAPRQRPAGLQTLLQVFRHLNQDTPEHVCQHHNLELSGRVAGQLPYATANSIVYTDS